jgi:NAD(P)-dependent dehydrogenase (short-subunit alcohol dehydrogenase family)
VRHWPAWLFGRKLRAEQEDFEMQALMGRTAVVTGGASGIGRGAAMALGARGVNVVVADIDAAQAEAVAAEIGGNAIGVAIDVAAAGAFEALKQAALARFGRVDIVMNNVGVLTRGLPEHLPLEEWQRILSVNLLSVVSSNLAFLPLLIAQGEGHIVNTASFAGLFTYSFDRLPYAASKAAIIQISEGLAISLRPKGIGVTVLCPGPVRTNISRDVRSFGPPTATLGPGTAFGLMEPAEVGELVADAIVADRFMVPTHPHVRELLVQRAEDWDGFLQRRIDDPQVIMPAGG